MTCQEGGVYVEIFQEIGLKIQLNHMRVFYVRSQEEDEKNGGGKLTSIQVALPLPHIQSHFACCNARTPSLSYSL